MDDEESLDKDRSEKSSKRNEVMDYLYKVATGQQAPDPTTILAAELWLCHDREM